MVKTARKLFFGLLSVYLVFTCCIRSVHADMGPKPSVTVRFENAPEEQFYVTLLSKKQDHGPWHADDEARPIDNEDALAFFRSYEDPDGYFFLNYARSCSAKEMFSWTYYPPDDFKILIYVPSTGAHYVSEPLSRFTFDAVYLFDFETSSAKEIFDYRGILINSLIRIAVTILLEVLLGILFGFKDKIRSIVIVNLVTTVILNFAVIFFDSAISFYAYVFVLPIFELFVFLAEAIAYSIMWKDKKKFRIWLYAFLANAFTYIGILLLWGIFQAV